MKKKLANWITHLIGMGMMLLGAYMIYMERPVTYAFLMFGLGTLAFASFNKLGDMFLGGIGFLLKSKSK